VSETDTLPNLNAEDYSLQSEIKHSQVLFWGHQMGFCLIQMRFCMHILTLVYLMFKENYIIVLF